MTQGFQSRQFPSWGWGDGFIDYDNDGWKDIFIANGHVYPQADSHDWGRVTPSGRCCFVTAAMAHLR